ncbi:hypothetical protein RF11_10285 [Thelohanellus kitauei]|uniref:Uncharacterized protein n=1 Tax=Thelohanellus kitauei TaxID=669202 RepID=A0A0C2JEH4_THEKT|nr:hypothetical protein RF11_10285 [Thelohanellus kitauei]
MVFGKAFGKIKGGFQGVSRAANKNSSNMSIYVSIGIIVVILGIARYIYMSDSKSEDLLDAVETLKTEILKVVANDKECDFVDNLTNIKLLNVQKYLAEKVTMDDKQKLEKIVPLMCAIRNITLTYICPIISTEIMTLPEVSITFLKMEDKDQDMNENQRLEYEEYMRQKTNKLVRELIEMMPTIGQLPKPDNYDDPDW